MLQCVTAQCVPVLLQVLEQLVSKLLSQMPLLLRLLDHIALLDMLLAFFQAVTGGGYCGQERTLLVDCCCWSNLLGHHIPQCCQHKLPYSYATMKRTYASRMPGGMQH